MAEESLLKNGEFAHLLFENARDAIFLLNEEGTIIAANSMACAVFQYPREELLENKLQSFVGIHQNKGQLIETVGYTKNGEAVPFEISISQFVFQSEHYSVYILRDISNRKAVEEEIYRLANIDPLTELQNRRYMSKRIEQERHRAERSGKSFAFIMGDIDGFKQFNDNYGHDCGDYVLVEIAKLLRETIRKQDIVARWGGEEFLFLLPETDKEGACKTADKVRNKIGSRNFNYNEMKIRITMTFGVAECLPGDKVQERIKEADTALLLGKNRGKDCVVSV